MQNLVVRSFAVMVFLSALWSMSASAQAQSSALPAAAPPEQTPLPSPAPEPVATASPQARRGMDAPLDPVFPSVDFPGPAYLIGVPSDPGNRAYGWIDAGSEFSTSKRSNFPLSYNDVPNNIQLDQAIFRVEKQPDTVQQEHFDWGYRFTSLYGVDYRYTTMQGVLSNQLLLRNQTNGYDPVEAYLVGYFPHWEQGTVVQIGRFISPADIEANLSPQNFLYTHSLMFTFDCYTQMGVLFTTMMSKQWSLVYGLHFDSDTAAWDGSAHFPTAELFGRYVTPSNRNSLLFGVDAINDGQFKTYTNGSYIDEATGQVKPTLLGHDNLQQFNVTWTHVFTPRLQNQFETYYLYSLNAYEGGTINNYNVATGGPPYLGGGGGPGAFLPGLSTAVGSVDYLEYAYSKKGFLSLRFDYLNDPRGWRSGFATSYGSVTLGTTYHATPWFTLRPEVRTEKAFRAGVTPYDNGTKAYQSTFGIDGILFFGNP